MDPVQRIEEFLRAYERNCTLEDETPLIGQFSDPFQIATPQGTAVLDREHFAAGISRRRRLLEQMGCGAAEMVSIQTTLLDQRYALARTRWKFSPGDPGDPIFTESSFLIEEISRTPKIVLYLSHDDLQGMLAARSGKQHENEMPPGLKNP
jgi:hypothetical protein